MRGRNLGRRYAAGPLAPDGLMEVNGTYIFG
jgi:hypothetical protein